MGIQIFSTRRPQRRMVFILTFYLVMLESLSAL
jgi:hypothetical protein